MSYRLVIFDFDGTLADSFGWLMSVINEVAARYQFKRIEPHEVETLRAFDHRQLIQHLGVPPWKIPWIAASIRCRMRADIAHIQPFEGVNALLRRLADRGVETAVVTSNSESNVRRVLGSQNAARIRYYGCGASLFGKAQKFRRIVLQSGIPRDRVLCVGDEVRDIQAARSEKLTAGAVGWGFASPALLRAHAPDLFFTSLGELAQRIA